MIYTIILLLQNGKFHVAECEDPETYIKSRNKRMGFWSWNRGKAKLIKIYKGEYKHLIHKFGIKNLLEMFENEAELEHFVIELSI